MTNEHDIDKLFQDQLGPDSDPKGVWSDPGDDAFFAAMSKIDEQKRDKRRPFLWWFTGAILIALISSLLFLNNRIDDVESKLTTSTQQQFSDELISSAASENNETIYQDQSTSLNTQNQTISSPAQNVVQTTSRKSNINNIGISSKKSIVKSTVNSEAVIDAPATSFTDLTKKIVDPVRSNSLLNYLPLTLSQLPTNSNTYLHPPVNPELASDHAERKSSISLEVSGHRTSWAMSDIQIPNGELTEYDKYYNGWSTGLAWEQAISPKWSILGRLGYMQMENHSIYKNKINFEENKVRNDNGQFFYDMNLTIANPMDKQTEPISALIENTSLTNGEALKQKTHITHNLDWLYLSVSPHYQLISTHNFTMTAGLGLQANYLFEREAVSLTEIYKATEVVMKEITEKKATYNENTFSLSALGSIRLDYSLTDKITLGTHFNYNFGLGPINEQHSIRSGKTFIRDFSSGVYIGYNF